MTMGIVEFLEARIAEERGVVTMSEIETAAVAMMREQVAEDLESMHRGDMNFNEFYMFNCSRFGSLFGDWMAYQMADALEERS